MNHILWRIYPHIRKYILLFKSNYPPLPHFCPFLIHTFSLAFHLRRRVLLSVLVHDLPFAIRLAASNRFAHVKEFTHNRIISSKYSRGSDELHALLRSKHVHTSSTLGSPQNRLRITSNRCIGVPEYLSIRGSHKPSVSMRRLRRVSVPQTVTSFSASVINPTSGAWAEEHVSIRSHPVNETALCAKQSVGVCKKT